ncbi:DUF982 domain-containing protein [Rhizobium sp. LC145]|jgi:hypothetical protein|uniref:DUF982 domain-containing protein n=1 Tax=Rhizobium sp. LC145 TaxID=1120688 RepID=UPI00062A2C2E|nr:DUF982 domain-containing protein [Rhizobium sp. LC145]KKX32950.1 hypothetical protein YH62_05210 [Rhizobium sp. LC145]TKT57363.1 DUF982 domain-containing protein [Rhizobiaceae bacterium LC148]
MRRGHWERPITYEEDNRGGYRTIWSAEEAAHALLLMWPVDDGDEYWEAQRVCLAVMEGERSAEDARIAFLKAAAEAGVFVRGQ